MTRNQRQNRHLTAAAWQVGGTLPTVEVVGYDTVPMTDEQYTAAVQALAVLIASWQAARAVTEDNDTGGQLAA